MPSIWSRPEGPKYRKKTYFGYSRTELFKKSPLYTLPLEWNMLDENRYIGNRITFKTALKYLLLNSVMDGAANGIDP